MQFKLQSMNSKIPGLLVFEFFLDPTQKKVENMPLNIAPTFHSVGGSHRTSFVPDVRVQVWRPLDRDFIDVSHGFVFVLGFYLELVSKV